jgi:N-acetylmuramoyl-L-alanine amidase
MAIGLCCTGLLSAIPMTTAAGKTAGISAICSDGTLRVGLVVGHSRQHPGAISASGKTEYSFNARFAKELVSISRRVAHPAMPLKMFIVNPGGRAVKLRKRAKIARRLGAEILLSIHHDSAQKKYFVMHKIGAKTFLSTPNIRGYSLFVSRMNKNFSTSQRLGLLIGRSFRIAKMHPTEHHAEDIPGERREILDRETGLYEAPFAVLASADMPAVLIEVGVISNKAEEKELNRVEFRARAQLALIEALSAFCASAREKNGIGNED